MKDADLRVESLAADVLGGHARGNWEMQHMDAKVATSSLDAELKGIALTSASNAFAPPGVQRIPFSGTADISVKGTWTGPIENAVAHAQLAIANGGQKTPPSAVPVSGLVQVLLSSGRPVLRRGETLLASRRGIDGWRNMGEGDAQCLWVLRD